MTQLCARHVIAAAKPAKYRNRKAESLLVGRSFASKAERDRGEQLALLEKAGEIRNLKFQVPVPLVVNGVKVTTWIADFVYETRAMHAPIRSTAARVEQPMDIVNWQIVYEDMKGFRTDLYRLKAKLFHAIFGFEIYETHPKKR